MAREEYHADYVSEDKRQCYESRSTDAPTRKRETPHTHTTRKESVSRACNCAPRPRPYQSPDTRPGSPFFRRADLSRCVLLFVPLSRDGIKGKRNINMGMFGNIAKKGTSYSRNQGMGAEAPRATNHLHPPWERRASSTRTSIMDEAGLSHAPGRVCMHRPQATESEERNVHELCRQAGGPEDRIKESIRVTSVWGIILEMRFLCQSMSGIFTELIPRDLVIRLR